MPRVKWLLPLLLLVCGDSARGAVLPSGVSWTGECNSYINVVGTSPTIQCDVANVNTGDLVLVYANLVSATTYSVNGTESLTCPAGALATNNFSGFVHNVFICYVVAASSHSDFNVNIPITNVGGGARQGILHVEKYTGVGAFDSGSAAHGNLANSANYTTANANELTFCFYSDLSQQITPSGSNNFHDTLLSADNGVQGYRQLYMIQNTAAAGSYTCSGTTTASAGVNFVSTLSFQVSGGTPQGPVYFDEHYHFLRSDVGSNTKPVYFYNVSNGQKGIITYQDQDVLAATCAVDTGETCTCDAGAKISISPINNYTQGICRVDFTANHSGYVTFTISPGNSTAAFQYLSGYLATGLNSGADTASAAAANSTSVAFTTAAANEWTICLATSTKTTYPMGLASPTGTPSQAVNNGYSDILNLTYTEGLDMFAKTVSSGSNTCSFSNPNINPLLSTISFGAPSTFSPRDAQIF